MSVDHGSWLERLHELLEAGNEAGLRAHLIDHSSEDLEEYFEELDSEERQTVLSLLEPETAAEVLGGVEEYIQEEMADALSERELAELVEEMDSDEAADTIRHLESKEQEKVFDLLAEDTEQELRSLLAHEEDTAGDLMMAELAAIHEEALVAEAIEELRTKSDEIKQLYAVYIVDDDQHLKGMLSLRDLVLARPGMPLNALMEPVPAAVTPEMDQEEVAILFRRYDLVTAPVVDANGVLVGRITVDDVLEVLEEEASEDLSRLAGLGSEEAFHPLGLLRLSRDRLPWLILGLFGGLFSGRILQGFEASIAEIVEIAFFVPVIMALAGNIGIQSSTIIVRGLATGEVREGALRPRILREIAVSLLNGVVIGILSFLVVWLWLGHLILAIVVASSMLAVVLWATLTGTVVPLAMHRMGRDPAYATGPFVTTTNDIVALTIYLSIAYHTRHLLG